MKANGNAPHLLKCSSKMCLFHHNRPSQLIAYVLFAAHIVVTCYFHGKAEGRGNIPHLLHQVFISPHQTFTVDCYLKKAWVSNTCFTFKKTFLLSIINMSHLVSDMNSRKPLWDDNLDKLKVSCVYQTFFRQNVDEFLKCQRKLGFQCNTLAYWSALKTFAH